MKHLFIINPAAGKTDHTKETIEKIREAMSAIAPEDQFEIYITKGPMDACGAISERATDGEELRVYACGGDGTLNECANGAAGMKNVALTHYPSGTGNDFCKIFGEGAEKFKDLKLLIGGEEMTIDLIKCNDRYSINICSVGIDARIGTDVHKYSDLPLVSGHGAYIISTAVNFIKGISRPLKVIIDDEVSDGELSLICCCNGRYYGGGFNPIPEAQPDDGMLDFIIIKKVSRLAFIKLIGKYKQGRFRELPDTVIKYHRGKTLRVESHDNIRINVDGEQVDGLTAEFTVAPKMLRFFFPKGNKIVNHIQEDTSEIKI